MPHTLTDVLKDFDTAIASVGDHTVLVDEYPNDVVVILVDWHQVNDSMKTWYQSCGQIEEEIRAILAEYVKGSRIWHRPTQARQEDILLAYCLALDSHDDASQVWLFNHGPSSEVEAAIGFVQSTFDSNEPYTPQLLRWRGKEGI